MLLSFRVANFRSIRDEQELSLRVPTGVRDSDEMAQAAEAGWDPGVSTVAGIYGANASGKSNVLDALRFMWIMVFGYRNLRTDTDEGIPVEPFRLSRLKTGEPSLFEVEILLDAVRYQYGFRVTSDRIVSEWLYALPHAKRQTWMERDNSSAQDDFYFGKGFSGQNQTIAKLTRPDRLFLEVATENNHALARPIFSWITRNLRTVVRVGTDVSVMHRFRYSERRPAPAFERLVDLMKLADLGISGIELVERTGRRLGNLQDTDPLPEQYELQFTHTVGDDDPIPLPLRTESRGTLAWFNLAERILRAFERGGVLLVDELDASLHPRLASEVIRMFRDPARNPRQGQLIFNAHDTSALGNLLGEPTLRRDQVWLTEKDERGATHLYPASDFKPRKLENLERGYLQGRYGAVPNIESSGLRLVREPSGE